MRVPICSGGVIGASIAYFLSCRGAQPTVIERAALACSASGRSGGFLALDWCDGTPLQALARRSFALHATLAEAIGEDWGYRRMTTYAGAADARRGAGDRALPWLSDAVALQGELGSPDPTAQVDPARFTTALMRAATAQGAALRIGTVTGLVRDGSGAR